MMVKLHWQYRNNEGVIANERSSVPYAVTCYNCYSHRRSLIRIRKDMSMGLEGLMETLDIFKEVISKDEHSKLMNLYVGCIADNPDEAKNPEKAELRNMQHRPQCSAHYFMGLAYLVGLNEFKKIVRQTVSEQNLKDEVDVQLMGDFDADKDLWKFAAKYEGNSIDLLTYVFEAKKTGNKKRPIEIKKTIPILYEGTEDSVERRISSFFS